MEGVSFIVSHTDAISLEPVVMVFMYLLYISPETSNGLRAVVLVSPSLHWLSCKSLLVISRKGM